MTATSWFGKFGPLATLLAAQIVLILTVPSTPPTAAALNSPTETGLTTPGGTTAGTGTPTGGPVVGSTGTAAGGGAGVGGATGGEGEGGGERCGHGCGPRRGAELQLRAFRLVCPDVEAGQRGSNAEDARQLRWTDPGTSVNEG